MWFIYRRLRLDRKQRNRNYWVNLINERENINFMGIFNSLFEELYPDQTDQNV